MMLSSDFSSLICDIGTFIMAVLFSLIVLRDTCLGFFVVEKFQVLVIPSPVSVAMDTEYEREATVSTNCSLSS